MGTIHVKGIGNVRIAGDTPTEEESRAIVEASSMQLLGPGFGRPATKEEMVGIPEEKLPLHQRPSFQNLPIGERRVRALATGIGTGIGNLARGIEQIVGIEPSKAAQEGADFIKWAKEQPDLSGPATVGEVAGTLLDPIALAVPVGRGASVLRRIAQGAGAGAAVGGLSYVEPGESRLENAAWTAAAAGLINPVVHAGIDRLSGAPKAPWYGKVQPEPPAPPPPRLALPEPAIPMGPPPRVPPLWELADQAKARRLAAEAARKRVATARGEVFNQQAAQDVAQDIIKARTPRPPQATAAAAEVTAPVTRPPKPGGTLAGMARALDTKANRQAAVEAQYGKDGMPFPERFDPVYGEGGTTLHANPFDPAMIRKATSAMQAKYGEFASPVLEAIQRNPGSAGGAVFGGISGYNTAPDDATPAEKAMRAAMGAAMGFGVARGVNKIPGATDWLSHGVIRDYGLPENFLRHKRLMPGHRNVIASRYLELAKEMGKTLTPEENRMMYSILQGEAPQDAKLTGLSTRARELITRYGQEMVDYGLLSPETFAKNEATYLHRSYTSKFGAKGPSAIGRRIRAIGSELKPRGKFQDVSVNTVPKWEAQGWERFGKPVKGKQRMRIQLTKEERASLGEIENAAYAVAETGRLMSNDIAAFKFYNDIAKDATIASTEEAPGLVQMSTDLIKGTKTRKYGNLAGMWVPESVANDLKNMDAWRHPGPAIRAYRRLNALWKAGKTALAPVAHMNNAVSNTALFYMSDAKMRELPRAATMMLTAARGKQSPEFRAAIEHGVFDADFATNELRGFTEDMLRPYLTVGQFSDPISAAEHLVKKGWHYSGGAMVRAYQKADHVFRLAVFNDRVARGMDPEKAAIEARNWFIDYNINAPFINFLRDLPLPFIAWTYGVIPRLVETAVMRPWKFAALAVLGHAINQYGESRGPGDTEKERKLMPERQQGTAYGIPGMPPQMIKLPSGLGTEQGQYLDVTRYIPGGDIMDTQEGQMIPGLPAPLQPSFGVAGSIAQAMAGDDWFKHRRLPGLGLGQASDAKIKAQFLARQMLPNNPVVPGSTSFNKIQSAHSGVPASPMSDVLPPWQAWAQSLGVKISPADIQKMTLRAGADTRRQMQALQETMRADAMELRAGRMDKDAFIKRRAEHVEQGRKIIAAFRAKVD